MPTTRRRQSAKPRRKSTKAACEKQCKQQCARKPSGRKRASSRRSRSRSSSGGKRGRRSSGGKRKSKAGRKEVARPRCSQHVGNFGFGSRGPAKPGLLLWRSRRLLRQDGQTLLGTVICHLAQNTIKSSAFFLIIPIRLPKANGPVLLPRGDPAHSSCQPLGDQTPNFAATATSETQFLLQTRRAKTRWR